MSGGSRPANQRSFYLLAQCLGQQMPGTVTMLFKHRRRRPRIRTVTGELLLFDELCSSGKWKSNQTAPHTDQARSRTDSVNSLVRNSPQHFAVCLPETKQNGTSAGLMVGWRHRRRPSIEPGLAPRRRHSAVEISLEDSGVFSWAGKKRGMSGYQKISVKWLWQISNIR